MQSMVAAKIALADTVAMRFLENADTTQIDASAKTSPTAEWLYKRILKENGVTVNSCPTAY